MNFEYLVFAIEKNLFSILHMLNKSKRKALKEKKRPSLDEIKRKLIELKINVFDVDYAIKFYCDYFDIPNDYHYYKSNLTANFMTYSKVEEYVKIEGRKKPISIKLATNQKIIYRFFDGIDEHKLYKHILSSDDIINPNATINLKLCSKPLSRWLIFEGLSMNADDIVDGLPYFSKKPNLIEKIGRNGERIIIYFLLKEYYSIEIIQKFAKTILDRIRKIENSCNWLAYPKDTESALPVLPFGFNSHIIHDGKILEDVGISALIKWYKELKKEHILTIPTNGIIFDQHQHKLQSTTLFKKRIEVKLSLKGKKIREIELMICDLFNHPYYYRRRDAQQLLKFHFQGFCNLNPVDSAKQAWDWMCNNIYSNGIIHDPDSCKAELEAFFKEKPINCFIRSKRKNISLVEFKEILKRLKNVHNDIKKYETESTKRKGSTLLSVYSLYIFLYNEMITTEMINGTVEVLAKQMKKWPGCSEGRYVKAIEILTNLKLVNQIKTKPIVNKITGEIKQDCFRYFVEKVLLPKIPKDYNKKNTFKLDKASFINRLVLEVPASIGRDLFGVTGYNSRMKKYDKLVDNLLIEKERDKSETGLLNQKN